MKLMKMVMLRLLQGQKAMTLIFTVQQDIILNKPTYDTKKLILFITCEKVSLPKAKGNNNSYD